MTEIKTVAWLFYQDNKVLCVRTAGKDKFYIPGGKIDAGETLSQALQREIREELNIDIVPESISPATCIQAPAHGAADDVGVVMECFFADYQGEIRADSEIEEVRWMGGEYSQLCAPAAQQAIEFLCETGKVVIENEVVV